MPTLFMFLVATLATWRITHLFHAEDGPGKMFVHFRRLFGESMVGDLLDCFYCLSVWVALPPAFLLGQSWSDRLWLWPALSAGACLLFRWTEPEENHPVYFEEKEV